MNILFLFLIWTLEEILLIWKIDIVFFPSLRCTIIWHVYIIITYSYLYLVRILRLGFIMCKLGCLWVYFMIFFCFTDYVRNFNTELILKPIQAIMIWLIIFSLASRHSLVSWWWIWTFFVLVARQIIGILIFHAL